jgi:hypothetical protein
MHSHPGRFRRQSLKFALYACLFLCPAFAGLADRVFDNISNFETGVSGANISVTGGTPNTFMGDGYALVPGTTNITGFDIFPANLSGVNFTGVTITIFVWGNVNTGTVNASSPAFSNLLATYTVTVTATFNSGTFLAIEGNPAGTSPGLTLATPLNIAGTNIGLSFNVQGTTDGINYSSYNSLTSLIAYGTPPTAGGQLFNGYFRNVNSEANGNFTAGLRSLGVNN